MTDPEQPADAPSVEKRFSFQWSWLGLAFSFSERKFIVGRKRAFGGIHLTISYGNVSGEVDIHLKREPAPPGEDPYISLARVAPERLTRAGEHINAVGERLARSMLDHWRPVRPGWLARNGYLITLLEKEPSAEMLRELFLPFAPRRYHGKHQLTFAPLKDRAYLAKYTDRLYYADALRDLEPGIFQQPIRATPTKRGRPTLLVASFNVDGRPEWFMCPEHRTREGMDLAMAGLMTVLGDGVDSGHLEIFRRITNELGFEEIPELADFIKALTEFLSAPQDAVGKAQRRAKAWTPGKRLHPKCLALRLRERKG